MYTINTSVTTTYTTPSAHLTAGRNRIKNYGGKYYLNDGQEFELELFNPDSSNRVMVKIWMNEKLISNDGLVLNANSRHYLERYLDTNKKFKFKTFKVDDVKETEEARNRNGKVRIEFYNEIQYYSYYPTPWDWTPTANPTLCPSGTANFSTQNIRYTTGVDTSVVNTLNASITSEPINSSRTLSKQVETGRVSEGGKSKQKFGKTNGTFGIFPIYSVEFQILPHSTVPVNLKDVRNYCSECGHRIRKAGWKYCPECGHTL